jgi:hypothetical protein
MKNREGKTVEKCDALEEDDERDPHHAAEPQKPPAIRTIGGEITILN